MNEKLDLAGRRREYTLAGLRRAELDPDPMAQFAKWFKQAQEAGLAEPGAMILSTADKSGHPSARTVLLKVVDQRGFIFFSYGESRKSREMGWNPNAALVFHWPDLDRQVCIAGTVTRIGAVESEKYFSSRPREIRLAAWVSNQSEPIPNRALLEKRLAAVIAKFPGEEIPPPPTWTGFCVAPHRLEFWQGRTDRLNDRFEYLKLLDNSWQIERLAP